MGKTIGSFQRIQDMLVDMSVEIEAVGFFNLKAAFLRDQGQGQAVQIHGGYGYMDEFPVSRYYRDIRAATIGDGTSEIQRMIEC